MRLPTNHVTSLFMHPLEPYVAVSEMQCVNPKIYIYKYPEMTETVLKGSGKLEIRQAVFSSTSYLATVSGTPDFLLSLWNFKNNTLMCQSHLNGALLTTFSFCPTNWRILTGTDERCLHIWQIELCKDITLVHCRSIALPSQSAPIGLKESDGVVSPSQEQTQEPTRFDPFLPENATSGVPEEKKMEFADYTDQTERVLCISHTWYNNELLFLGCRYGQLLLVDPISAVIRILMNPLSYQTYSIGSESMDSKYEGSTSFAVYQHSSKSKSSDNPTTPTYYGNESFTVPFGCFAHLIFTKHGIFCAGKDGFLRLITLTTTKQTKPTLENGNGQSVHVNPILHRLQFNSCHKVFSFTNPFEANDNVCSLRVTGLAVSTSYGRLAISSLTGQFAILDLFGNTLNSEQSLTAEHKFLTSGDSFVGLGLLGPDKKQYVATARRNGLMNIWAVHSGELIGSISIGERCYSVAASPLYPVVAMGLKSGVLLILDCTKPDAIRIVRSLKLFRNPVTRIRFDHTGELLLAVADDEKAIAVSGHATNEFDPVGHIDISGKVIDLSLLRAEDIHGTFGYCAMGGSIETGSTNILVLEFKSSILCGIWNSCRGLRDDAIRLMQLQLDSPAATTCLWPRWDTDPNAPPFLFTTDLDAKKLFIYVLPKELTHKTNVKCTTALHEYDRTGIMGAEFCGDLKNLISCGNDGLLSLTELSLGNDDTIKVDGYLAALTRITSEQTEALGRLPTYTPRESSSPVDKPSARVGQSGHNSFRPLFFRSSTVMALVDHTIDLSGISEYSDEPLEAGPILSDPRRPTWTEECEMKAQETENQVYTEVQEKLKSDLLEISQLALQHEEVDDEEEQIADVNRVMDGSIVDCQFSSTIAFNGLRIMYYLTFSIFISQDNIFRIKEAFNKMFDEVYEKKETGLGRISSRLARVRKILIDLQQPSSARVIFDPHFSPEEQPEQLLTVHDAEITVEKYLSPAQLAELEAKKGAEEERKRREKLDNWRERGLEEMMGGVLEVRKEDELKKDVPKPAFLLTGKPLGHWTEDDKRLYAEYERKVKELNEEREKYRKFLESDVKKMYAQIDEEKAKFDEQLLNLFQHWISVQVAVLHEELKVWRLKWMLLIEEELFVREHELTRLIDRAEWDMEEMKKTLEAAQKALEDEQQRYEIQCAEDRLLEKNFRKDFSDVHGPLYDYIAKVFRRRPRRAAAPGSATNTTDADAFDRMRSHDQPGSTIFNPYVEKPTTRRVPTDQKAIVDEYIKELDNDPAHESQPGMDHTVWDRLCKYRRRKIEKEMEIKATALHLAEMNAFVQKREQELNQLANKRDSIRAELGNLLKDYHRNQTDLELQLLVKQGQVEIEVSENAMVHDFSDALLIDRERVEALNKHIITLGESKVAHMIKNKEFKKRFYHLEWELRQMLMQYEDLQAKQADIRKFKITREIQKYLECSDYDAVINSQILTIEQTINLQRNVSHLYLTGRTS
ncbi:WDR96 [Fasciola gigantica]|uniref:Cilia- and flagella-associated protein 43 n=1 Tax=Fasciola gigantica TaxID=46835 RepID=A0A504Z015_FASGI|nr:WDR96 [Fasciola gigantica]